jgi:uncharacterized membrane protein
MLTGVAGIPTGEFVESYMLIVVISLMVTMVRHGSSGAQHGKGWTGASPDSPIHRLGFLALIAACEEVRSGRRAASL